MGGLRGGKKLRKYLEDLQKQAEVDLLLRVGFLEGATHTTKGEGGELVPVAQVAAWNEWGDPKRGRPPRPFFRQMVAEKRGKWPVSMAKLLKLNQGNLHHTMVMMGEGIAGQLRQSINEFEDPPLKESTVKAKGFSKPLIDTAEMLRAVDFQVLEGEDATAMYSQGTGE